MVITERRPVDEPAPATRARARTQAPLQDRVRRVVLVDPVVWGALAHQAGIQGCRPEQYAGDLLADDAVVLLEAQDREDDRAAC